MTSFRFALLSDVHLGAPRFGVPALAEDAAQALEDSVDACLAAEVDFVLLAGNLFHRPLVAPADLERAERALGRLEGTPVLANEGVPELPSTAGTGSYLRYLGRRGLVRALVPTFDSERQRYSAREWTPERGSGSYSEPLPGVRIHGLGVGGGLAETRLAHMIPVLDSGDVTTIGLYYGARGDLGVDGLRALRSKLDFVACGHPRETGHDGWAYHPGGLVPVRLRDVAPEPPGIMLVEYEGGKYQTERVLIPGRAVVRLPDFQAPACDSPDELLRVLDQQLGAQVVPPEAVVALRLTGTVNFPFPELDPARAAEVVRENLQAAHALISNELNLAGPRPDTEAGPVDRKAIERAVLREALEEEVPELLPRRDELLDLLEAIRRKALGGDEDLGEVLALAKAYVERDDAAP